MSEVMLQQTQAARVAPAFDRFVARFPHVGALASATRAEVIRAWAGLGYNRRAVAIHRAAQIIEREFAGRVPSDAESLRRLPGVGPYTAAAVGAIAHGLPVVAMDTNLRRVVARAALGRDPSQATATQLTTAAAEWLDRNDPGGWNQAIMDLGRELCRPAPRCEACPLKGACLFASRQGGPASSPRRHGTFEGSSRQLRGQVVAVLRGVRVATVGSIASSVGASTERTVEVIGSLAREGLVDAGPAATAGRPRARVRLAAGP